MSGETKRPVSGLTALWEWLRVRHGDAFADEAKAFFNEWSQYYNLALKQESALIYIGQLKERLKLWRGVIEEHGPDYRIATGSGAPTARVEAERLERQIATLEKNAEERQSKINAFAQRFDQGS